jgi:2-polyprenyl-6-methoxyphenol hydroxylase-like FAD-dependent oxidoreductase
MSLRIAIVGAGPAGASLALGLARQGMSVQLIEASRNFRRTFRGEALMPSGLAAITQLGLDDILAKTPQRPLDRWSFWIEGRSLFQVDEPIEPGGQPCTLISQPAFLSALIEQAQTYTNFELIQGSPVQDLIWQGERVTGVRLGNGQTLAADLVVGADGRQSIVRQKANLPMQQDNQSLNSNSQQFDILWFKLPAGKVFEQNPGFHSIVQAGQAFGVFCSCEGNLQLGWSIQRDNPIDWRNTDWPKTLSVTSPPWLASHFQQIADEIEAPVLLSVQVGRCLQWHRSGVLVLGDAAHPMSPIRAQGINMALRDAMVAVKHLTPKLDLGHLETALAQIQADREPEIIRIQALQKAEMADAEKLRRYPPLRFLVSRSAPLLGRIIQAKWLHRQRQLRQGLSSGILG